MDKADLEKENKRLKEELFALNRNFEALCQKLKEEKNLIKRLEDELSHSKNKIVKDDLVNEIQNYKEKTFQNACSDNLDLDTEEEKEELKKASEENKRMFFIPRVIAHGFLTLTDNVEFQYKCDNLYNKASEGGIRYDDSTINVDWGALLNGIEPILSEKDTKAPSLEECNANFIYGEN